MTFLAYLLFMPTARLTPGDANGGLNGSLLLELGKRRDGHYLLQSKHVIHVLEILALTAPAVMVFLAVLALTRRRPRPLSPLLALGGAGLIFAILFNPNPWWDAIYDFDMYAPALAPLQLGVVLATCALIPRGAPWGGVARGALVVVSAAMTLIFHRWIWERKLGVPGLVDHIPLVWFPTTAPLK